MHRCWLKLIHSRVSSNVFYPRLIPFKERVVAGIGEIGNLPTNAVWNAPENLNWMFNFGFVCLYFIGNFAANAFNDFQTYKFLNF